MWHSRWLENKLGTQKQFKSAIKEHAEHKGHNVTSTDATIMEKRVFNFIKRKFLEAIHSCMDNDSVNEHVDYPQMYLSLLRSLGNN